MHIADGILPTTVSVAAGAVAIGMVYLGGRKVEPEEIPRMGVFAAALFVVSLIHIPFGATSIHLGLYGMAGLLFGLRALPIIFVDLLFQTLIFQHGGLLSLGVNTITMGSGALAAWGVWKLKKINKVVRSALCGFLGIMVPALVISLLFVLVDYGKGMLLILSVYSVQGVLEAALTVFVFGFFNKVKPELLRR